MSILIKGIDMPKTCEECEVWSLCHYPKVPKGIGRREPDCPLVEIPIPHGRLIDRDDIYIGRWDIDSDLAEQIQNAPTILEEEP